MDICLLCDDEPAEKKDILCSYCRTKVNRDLEQQQKEGRKRFDERMKGGEKD